MLLFIMYYKEYKKSIAGVTVFLKQYCATKLFSTMIRNVYQAANQHISMISKGSYDTED